jgi:two-component system sensor histidine kinase ChiS
MKIRYKLIIIFIIIIMSASLPLSLYILNKQEEGKVSLITHQGRINSSILARSIRNIILSNGLNIYATRVDANEMISILEPLESNGLIYADAVLFSSNKSLNGTVLASYINRDVVKQPLFNTKKLSADEINRLSNHRGVSEIRLAGIDDVCDEFVSFGSLPKIPKLCIGRLIFSRSVVLKPIHDLRLRIIEATILAIAIVSLLGLVFSRLISKPIAELTTGVKRIGEGNFQYKVPVKTGDELGTLASTFNQLTATLENKISELENTNRELHRLDALKDEFLANISHELRSPLQGIIGLSETFISGALGPQNQQAMNNLRLIISNARRLSGLVNDILDFSRLRNFDIVLQRTAVDIHAVVSLVVSLLQPVIDRKSLKVQNLIIPKSEYVDGDPDRLQQIIMNLIDNAVKFTDRGRITISVDKQSGNGIAVITIADTGIGIPADKMERIFEEFEQVDGSTTRSHSGTGLGLAITKKLVELHGGEIWVESEPGKGSCFYVSIPRATVRIPDDEMILEPSHELEQKSVDFTYDDIRIQRISKRAATDKDVRTVLVVDDEALNLQVLINHLSLAGYSVDIATDGSQALEFIEREGPPDLILLDIMLPKISGYEVCRIIRQKYTQYELPIIMLTARNKPGDVVTGLEVGANDYIIKPVEKQELLARVNNFISLKDSIEVHNELSILQHELSLADEIQQSLLPENAPHMDNISIAVRYTPVSKLGGDFYDFLKFDDSRLGILISDVSGHGIPAAFVASMFEVSYTFARDFASDPALFLKRINDAMSRYTHGQYLTVSYALMDLRARRMYYSNAGHLPLLIWRRESQLIITCKPKGRPIGVFSDSEYHTEVLDLQSGDRILFITDGLIEIRNNAGDFYGMRRIWRLIKKYQDLSEDEFLDVLIADIEKWSGKNKDEIFMDDVTVIVVDVKF